MALSASGVVPPNIPVLVGAVPLFKVKTYLVTATGGDPDFIPDILPPGWHWISGFEADTYATVRIPIMPPLSPRQSEILILLGIALLALRKLPDRAGAVA